MPFFPGSSRGINTNPKTPAQLRATLARLAKSLTEDADDIGNLQDITEVLQLFAERTAEADVDITKGDILRLASEGHVELADASDISTADVAGIALEDANSGFDVKYSALGVVKRDGWGLTAGSNYYLSTTAGAIVTSPIDATGNVSIIVGRALSPEQLFFNPRQPVIL